MASAIANVFTSPSLGDKCCDPGDATPYTSKGQELKVADLSTYQVGNGSNAVVFVTDIFGWQFGNNRLLADLIADGGDLTVLMPDMFNGYAMTVEQAINQGQMALMKWLPSHTQASTVAMIVAFVKHLKQQGKYKTIQAIGFCYGDQHVAQLLADGEIDAGIITHPAMMSPSFAENFQKPVLFNFAEKDEMFPIKSQQQVEQKLKEKGIPAQFIQYPGVGHGFASRAKGRTWNEGMEAGDANTELQQQKVRQNIVQFLVQHAK